MCNGKFSSKLWMLLMVLAMSGLFGCNNSGPRTPAPIGDHAALEQLATAYRSVADGYPVQPTSMRPKVKKDFVQRVFTTAGYHYGATLSAFANQGVDITNQDQRDLAELLLLPLRGLGEEDMKKLFSAEELQAIRILQADLK